MTKTFINTVLALSITSMLAACGESDQEKIARLEMENARLQGYQQGVPQSGNAQQPQQTQVASAQPIPAGAQPVIINNTQPPAQVATNTGIDAGDVLAMAAIGATAGLLTHAAMAPRYSYESDSAFYERRRKWEAEDRAIRERNRRYVAEQREAAARSENAELCNRLRQAESDAQKYRANPSMKMADIPSYKAQQTAPITPSQKPALSGNVTPATKQITPQQSSGGLFSQKPAQQPTQPYQQPAQQQQPRQGFNNQQQVKPIQPSNVEYKNSSSSSSGRSGFSSSSSSRSSSSGRGR